LENAAIDQMACQVLPAGIPELDSQRGQTGRVAGRPSQIQANANQLSHTAFPFSSSWTESESLSKNQFEAVPDCMAPAPSPPAPLPKVEGDQRHRQLRCCCMGIGNDPASLPVLIKNKNP
jgi:hypothetical protein